MRSKLVWLGFLVALIAALAWINDGEAQPPGKKGPPFGKKGGPPVSAEQIVDRLMSFDKNNDGQITAEELPERMQHLVALGDTNKDGALDREELTKLARTLAAFTEFAGPGGPGGPGGGPPPGVFGPKGGGPKGGAFKGAVGEAQRTLDDLNITGSTRDKADRALRLQQDKLRRFEELTRAELMLQMKDVLNEEDYRLFKTALDRPGGPPGFKGPRTPPDLRGRIDQLQKELDELRGKLAN
jgi:hypothetical protein